MTDAPTPSASPSAAQRFGATPLADAYGEQAAFDAIEPARLAEGFASPLVDHGVLHAGGPEAVQFLHGQFTNDVEHLGADDARRFGYCTAKGRLFAAMLGWHDGEGVAFALPRALAEPVRKRLSMYVLRAKVRVEDRSTTQALFGVGGDGAPAALAALGLQAPEPMRVARASGRVAVGLPAVAVDGFSARRWLLCVPDADADAAWRELRRSLQPASTAFWRWTDVRCGVPWIAEATRERFVPQMVNLELVGGLSFTKGCYPGQEIVARSQYLGKLRRRMFVAHAATHEPAPGSDVSASGAEPCGEVVMAAPSPFGGFDVLFAARVDALEAGAPTVAGEALSPLRLPYEIPAQE